MLLPMRPDELKEEDSASTSIRGGLVTMRLGVEPRVRLLLLRPYPFPMFLIVRLPLDIVYAMFLR